MPRRSAAAATDPERVAQIEEGRKKRTGKAKIARPKAPRSKTKAAEKPIVALRKVERELGQARQDWAFQIRFESKYPDLDWVAFHDRLTSFVETYETKGFHENDLDLKHDWPGMLEEIQAWRKEFTDGLLAEMEARATRMVENPASEDNIGQETVDELWAMVNAQKRPQDKMAAWVRIFRKLEAYGIFDPLTVRGGRQSGGNRRRR